MHSIIVPVVHIHSRYYRYPFPVQRQRRKILFYFDSSYILSPW